MMSLYPIKILSLTSKMVFSQNDLVLSIDMFLKWDSLNCHGLFEDQR